MALTAEQHMRILGNLVEETGFKIFQVQNTVSLLMGEPKVL
jgi:hypothetical protein